MPKDSRADRWLARLLDSKSLLWMVFVLSFLESILLPVPLELVLIPLLLHRRERWFAIATATLAGCLVGATLGYFVGVYFFETAGQWLLQWTGFSAEFASFQETFNEQAFATLMLVGITPIPFQVGMLTAGSTGYPYVLFLLASLLARGLRYYGLALLVYWLGERVLNWWQQHSKSLGWGVLIAGIAIYLVIISL
ncbi:hypothetical protein PSI9734_00606 [Pseudidiomarina piscicola]|uniref:VTT domain-containing protein n=1 Tax=Pseudidiomarina piscicola TaxID=2614830 RepID=A0A6S6WTM8_9GAMM|nr:VTT domain-containing protein [Pseudidiomarina piscicola]CAB0150034.1 hypothetical protein PSI9734_00606 [Pseudidiomarina piscicola]VZT39479.1 hypothetical protein PSI9734_00606 [Pseudomonas aeruginosa]